MEFGRAVLGFAGCADFHWDFCLSRFMRALEPAVGIAHVFSAWLGILCMMSTCAWPFVLLFVCVHVCVQELPVINQQFSMIDLNFSVTIMHF